jgi:hypothetical protein
MTTISWTAPTTRTDGSPLGPGLQFEIFDARNGAAPVVIANLLSTTSFNTIFSIGTHAITVMAIDSSGLSIPSSEVTITIAPISPPTNVTATPTSISWTAPATRTDGSSITGADISEYRVFDSVNGAAQAELGFSSGTTFNKNLSVGTHLITVTARDKSAGLGFGVPSDELIFTIAPPSAPTNVVVT